MAEEVKAEAVEIKEEQPKKQNFFKTTSFKCIIVLLAIVLVCGIILTICNSLFYVSDEERLNRTLSSVYDEDVDTAYVYVSDLEGVSLEYDNGTIETTELEVDGKDVEIAAFKILSYTATGEAINDYLIKVTGTGGFSGGSVTCWVAFTMDENYTAIQGVRKVTIGGNSGQSYISKISESDLDEFSTKYDGSNYTSWTGTGASYSMNAITNAVNTAMEFVNVGLLGAEDIYADFAYTTYIDKTATEHTITDGVVTYNIKTTGNGYAGAFSITVTVGSDKTVKSFEVTTNGSTSDSTTYYGDKMFDSSILIGKNETQLKALLTAASTDTETVSTGATLSNTLCVYSALFAVANYDLCISRGAQ